jgi:hypothetical protein
MHSLDALLANLIDYAGLFPPASLPLEQAIRNYADYQRGSDEWMLGRFICPTGQLAQLEPHLSLFDSSHALSISALGAKNVTANNFSEILQQSLTHVASFCERFGAQANVDALELTLPADITDRETFLDQSAKVLNQSGLLLTIFYEVQLASDWQTALQAIKRHNTDHQPVGVKLRCGGVTADAFPSPQQVATFIATCRDLDLQIKFTAGLHHPIRRYDESVQTKMFGFLNVLTASLIAYANRVDAELLETILADEIAEHFQFSDDGLSYDTWQIKSSNIARLRETKVLSYGSCSFDEPREDLKALGYLQVNGSVI